MNNELKILISLVLMIVFLSTLFSISNSEKNKTELYDTLSQYGAIYQIVKCDFNEDNPYVIINGDCYGYEICDDVDVLHSELYTDGSIESNLYKIYLK